MSDISSTDEILLNLMKEGDSSSFNLLFNRYWKKLYSAVFSICNDNDITSEIVHDVFLNLWMKRKQIEISNFKGYILASGRYHVYRYLKNAKRNPLVYQADPEYSSRIALNDGDLNMRYLDLERVVAKHLEELPKRCIQIFKLSRNDQLSNDEIAERLDISKRTVENQLTHALHHLRVSIRHFLIFLLILGI